MVQNWRYFWWYGTGFGIGFWAFVLNYMFKTWFRIRGLFDCLEPVFGSDFEHSYLITCSKFGSEFAVFWWSGTGLEIGFWAFVFNYKRFWRKKYMILIVSSSFFEPSVWRYVFFTRFLLCFFDLNGKSWFNHESSTSYLSTPAKHCSKISVF